MSINFKEFEIAQDENNATIKAEFGKLKRDWDKITSKISSKKLDIDLVKSEYKKRWTQAGQHRIWQNTDQQCNKVSYQV